MRERERNGRVIQTHEGPPSITNTLTAGFSVSRFAMTFPAVPPNITGQDILIHDKDVMGRLTSNDYEIVVIVQDWRGIVEELRLYSVE